MRQRCGKCGRELAVTTTRQDGDLRTQYFGCRACGIHAGYDPRVIKMSDSRTNLQSSSGPQPRAGIK